MTDQAPKFKIGDLLYVPSHGGNIHAHVVAVYSNYEKAASEYDGSFQTILQAPRGTPKPDQAYYVCEIANKGKKKIGTCDSLATIKAPA